MYISIHVAIFNDKGRVDLIGRTRAMPGSGSLGNLKDFRLKIKMDPAVLEVVVGLG